MASIDAAGLKAGTDKAGVRAEGFYTAQPFGHESLKALELTPLLSGRSP